MKLTDILTRADIVENLKTENMLGNYLELGVMRAEGLRIWNKYKPKRLIGIDVWTNDGNPNVTNNLSTEFIENCYKQSIQYMLEHPNVQLIRAYTQDMVQFFPDNFFDFIYVDDDHSKPATLRTLQFWWPKVVSGGLLCGHDYTHQFGVIEAVSEFLPTIEISRFHYTEDNPASFIIEKPCKA